MAISGGNGQSITYKSLSETIATVDTSGLVTGENAGKTNHPYPLRSTTCVYF
ncbi:MAG: hypothetical protein EBU96_04390 [Actinobacteria bacterium]|nr:hypothetical protein [Actinomycetota bacterium]